MQVYDSTAIWLEGFKSEATKRSYLVHLDRFCKFHRLTPDELAHRTQSDIKQLILEYIIHLKHVAKTTAGKPKSGEISVNSIPTYLAGVYSFLGAHEISIPRKLVERYYPEQVTNNFRAYTREEIAKMLSFADLRERCVTLLMVSSGIRIGAFKWLRFKDLVLHGDIALLVVYSHSKADRYVTFMTPECLNAIQEYKASRERQGEKILPESPLIRDKVAWMGKYTNLPRVVSEQALRYHLKYMLRKAGLNYDAIQPAHAFRKFFNTMCKNAGVDKDCKELFMGHSIDLDDIYYDTEDEHSREKLKTEYMKAVDALTINEENRLKRKVETLESEKSVWEKKINRLDEMRAKLEEKGLL